MHAGQEQHRDHRKMYHLLISWRRIFLHRKYQPLPCCTRDCCCQDTLQAIA
jgi:hypothetical protein